MATKKRTLSGRQFKSLPRKLKALGSDSQSAHGRYVAYVFASPRNISIDECFRNGIFINDALLQKKHARLVG